MLEHLQLVNEAEFKNKTLALMRKSDLEDGLVAFSTYTLRDVFESQHFATDGTPARELVFLQRLEKDMIQNNHIDRLVITRNAHGIFREALYIPPELYAGIFDREFVKGLINKHFSEYFLVSEILNYGMAFYPHDSKDFSELWQYSSHMAVRSASSSIPIEFYDPEKYAKILRKKELRGLLREFVREAMFDMHYQPQLELQAPHKLIGCEALLRPKISSSDGRIFNPFEVIVEVEEFGWMIIALGFKIIEAVCQDIQTWKSQGLSIPAVSVNLSVPQLYDQNFMRTLEGLLAQYGVDSTEIAFELTEVSHSGKNLNFPDNMAKLYENYCLYIDDYGTGHASAEHYLKHDFHGVKLDRSFITNINQVSLLSEKKKRVVTGMISAPLHAKQKVVFEGVETKQELAEVIKLCPNGIGQGWLWSPAIPAEQYARFLAKQEIAID